MSAFSGRRDAKKDFALAAGFGRLFDSGFDIVHSKRRGNFGAQHSCFEKLSQPAKQLKQL
jgi:hypothetical protein